MNLTSVYEHPDYLVLLWSLLLERTPEVNISHREMPGWFDHVAFVDSMPYAAWYFIEDEGNVVGACYLTKQNEIGVAILMAHRGKGCGPGAVKAIVSKHNSTRFLANINPANKASERLFTSLGFKKIQSTYEWTPSRSCETLNPQ